MIKLPIISEERPGRDLTVQTLDLGALEPNRIDPECAHREALLGLYDPDTLGIRVYTTGSAAVFLAQTYRGDDEEVTRINRWNYITLLSPTEVLQAIKMVPPPDDETWLQVIEDDGIFRQTPDAKAMRINGFGISITAKTGPEQFTSGGLRLHEVNMEFGQEIPNVQDAAAAVVSFTIHPGLQRHTSFILASELPQY